MSVRCPAVGEVWCVAGTSIQQPRQWVVRDRWKNRRRHWVIMVRSKGQTHFFSTRTWWLTIKTSGARRVDV